MKHLAKILGTKLARHWSKAIAGKGMVELQGIEKAWLYSLSQSTTNAAQEACLDALDAVWARMDDLGWSSNGMLETAAQEPEKVREPWEN